jgi:hypothetical protein
MAEVGSVELVGVTKRFGLVVAVDGIDLIRFVDPGESPLSWLAIHRLLLLALEDKQGLLGRGANEPPCRHRLPR